jgi:hypothetical protein
VDDAEDSAEDGVQDEPESVVRERTPGEIDISPAPPLRPAPVEESFRPAAIQLPVPDPPPEKPEIAMAPARPARDRDPGAVFVEPPLPELPVLPETPPLSETIAPAETPPLSETLAPVETPAPVEAPAAAEPSREDRIPESLDEAGPSQDLSPAVEAGPEADPGPADDLEFGREPGSVAAARGDVAGSDHERVPEPDRTTAVESVPGIVEEALGRATDAGPERARPTEEAARADEAAHAEPDDKPEPRIAAPIQPPRREPERTSAERTVRSGERFTVVLQGHGWIYLGGSGPVDYIGRETDRDEVRFLFRAQPTDGDDERLTLTFEAQDLTSGWRRRHEERVATEPAREPPTPIARRQPPVRPPIDAPAAGQADTPEQRNQEDGPIRETSEEIPFEERLRSAATATGPLSKEERDLLAEIGPEIMHPRETIGLAERLVAAEEPDEAIRLLEALLASGTQRYDHVLFLLASLYEQHGRHRNLERSHDLYRQLVGQYPMSDHWDAASARIEYIERHFLFIR